MDFLSFSATDQSSRGGSGESLSGSGSAGSGGGSGFYGAGTMVPAVAVPLKQSATFIAVPAPTTTTASTAAVCRLVKPALAQSPSSLLNVFYFWMLSLCPHGTERHNRTVLHHLLHVRSFASRRFRAATTSPKTDSRIIELERRVIRPLRDQLHVRGADTSAPIVGAFNCLGSEVFYEYMQNQGVIDADPVVYDLATVWAYVIAPSDPTVGRVPFADPEAAAVANTKFTDPEQMLRAMHWSQCIAVPGAASRDDDDDTAAGISMSGSTPMTP